MKVKCVQKGGLKVGSQTMKEGETRDVPPSPFLSTGLHRGALEKVPDQAATDTAPTAKNKK